MCSTPDVRTDEGDHRDGELLRMGVMKSAGGQRCVVSRDELDTAPMPWFVGRAPAADLGS